MGTHVDDQVDQDNPVGIDLDEGVTTTTTFTGNGTRTNTHMRRLISFMGILRMSECVLSLIGFASMTGAGSNLTVALAYTLGANVIVFTYTSILVLLYLLHRVQARIYKLPIYELCSNIVSFIVIFIASIVGAISCSNVCSSQYTSGEKSAIEASIVFTWLTGGVLVVSTLKIMLERSVMIQLVIRDK